MSQDRVAAGIPTGGEYTAQNRPESQVGLPTAKEPRMPLPRLRLASRNTTASRFIYSPEKFDLSAPYQRSSVWTPDQRRNLIKSVLMGLPIGTVTINDRGYANGFTGYNAVIDGKQRVETLIAFSKDEFAVPADWVEPHYVTDTVELEDGTPGIVYSTTPILQTYIDDAAVPTLYTDKLTLAEEAEVYLLVNSGGTGHTKEELELARSFINAG